MMQIGGERRYLESLGLLSELVPGMPVLLRSSTGGEMNTNTNAYKEVGFVAQRL
jgi:hypothetical protein